MANNKPLRKYFAIDMLVKSMIAGVGGFKAWILGIVLNFALRFVARQGVYFIDIGDVYISTNMDERTWLKVNGDSWEKVDNSVLTNDEGILLDQKYINAFDDFVVFSKVSNSSNN